MITTPTLYQRMYLALLIAVTALICIADTRTPLGFAHGTLYAPIVALFALTRNPRWVIMSALVSAALTVIGIFLSPEGANPAIYISNRLFSLLTIGLTAGVCLLSLRALQDRSQVHQQLDQSLDELQTQQFMLGIAGELGHIGGWVMKLPATADGEGELIFSDQVRRIYDIPPGTNPAPAEALSFFAPDSRPVVKDAFNKCMQHGTPYDLEAELINASGKKLWVRALGRPVHDSDGRVVEIHGALQDLTDEKNQAEAMAQSRQRFRQLADAMPLIVWTATPDGRLDYTNAEFNRITGTDADALVASQRWQEIGHPDDTGQYFKAWTASVASGEPFEQEFRLHTRDGGYRWYLSRAVPVHDNKGNIIKWYGTAMDIHDRKALEQQTRRSEERFRYLSRATSDVVWDWDPVNRILWWSEGMKALSGVEDEQIINTPEFWIEHIHPDDRDEVVASFQACKYGDTSELQQRYRFLRADGSVAMVVDQGFIIRDDSGKAIRMVGGMKDITREQSMQEQLQQSERLRAIGELTGGVAHDFNNLLTVIMGNSELLREQLGDNSSLDGLVRMIAQAAARGADLTQRMLAFARRQPLEPAPLDIKRHLDHMEPLFRRTLPANIDLAVIHSAGLWRAMADPSQLESALLNLCLNARDAMKSGGRLTLETANMSFDHEYCQRHGELEPGRYVMIAVSDTGTGMDKETLARAFDPFFTTRKMGEGTGLGLSMVYGFARQSGGHVKIYSEPGEGTTVRLYLPRTAEEPSNTDLSQPHASLAELPGGTETILVVEDDELVRSAVCDQLKRFGYKLLEAADATTALALFQSNEVDLLFTDVVLPGQINGKMLADRIIELKPGIKVLFTSGYTENAIVHQGRLDEGVQLLSKPYRQAELARRIREVLDSD